MNPRLAAISVDLDEVGEYLSIHALPPFADTDSRRHAVYDRALSRIDSWAGALSVPITFFAVGRDLDRPDNAASLRTLAARGHAVESHSLSHRYDLTRLSRAEMEREVTGGLDAVERAVGERPTGFRAPGYTVCDTLFDVLEEAGVAFDSSVFPSPVYLGAKALVLAWMRARGRSSASVLDTPRVLLSPNVPYRPGRPYYRPTHGRSHEGDSPRGGESQRRGLVELPIQVTPLLGFPVIGTSVGRAGQRGAELLAHLCSTSPLVNLELHGMDFLAAEDLAPHPLSRLQPELRAPLDLRLSRLTAFVEVLRRRGFTFVTLAEAAAHFG
ncbi:MAG: polysaccharide deacetylase family protein [Polyangiaceae bacterium]